MGGLKNKCFVCYEIVGGDLVGVLVMNIVEEFFFIFGCFGMWEIYYWIEF